MKTALKYIQSYRYANMTLMNSYANIVVPGSDRDTGHPCSRVCYKLYNMSYDVRHAVTHSPGPPVLEA